ncbi:MAG: hypothetical protein KBT36_14970 [Kurthia sp.]|nr:hypothetical protein [Candidatus Kurthia equi]
METNKNNISVAKISVADNQKSIIQLMCDLQKSYQEFIKKEQEFSDFIKKIS